MLERNIAATEDFFYLTPRFPHAVKTLYHAVQMPFLAIRYSHLGARMPSFLAGIAAVALLHGIIRRTIGSRWIALGTTVAFGLDPQVLYVSHFGRQEALILLVILGGIAVLTSGPVTTKAAAGAGGIVAAGVFIHPNAFIAAAVIFPWLLFAPVYPRPSGGSSSRRAAVFTKRVALVAAFAGVVAVGALAAVAVSLTMDPYFITNYRSFGETVGVSDNVVRRYFRLVTFFRNMAGRNMGTYYLPPVASRLTVGAILMALAVVGVTVHKVFRRGASVLPALSLAASVVALFIVGKYSPPSLVFLFPFIYLSAASFAGNIEGTKLPSIITGAVVVGMFALSVTALVQELPRWYRLDAAGGSYTALIDEVKDLLLEHDLEETPVLANLNLAFAFEPGRLRAFHDFAAIPRGDSGAVERYIREEKIGAVFLPRQEMDIIYRNRPVWNDVYGNPSRFYPQLLDVLEQQGRLVATIPAPLYGMRLLRYVTPVGGPEDQDNVPTIEVYLLQ